MPTTMTTPSSPGSAAKWATLANPALTGFEIATSRTFVERDRRQHVRTKRQLALLADDATARVDQLNILQHHELDGARARLARGQVARNLGSSVVLDQHAVADQVVQLGVVRHREPAISR